jgi:hypothetical protein
MGREVEGGVGGGDVGWSSGDDGCGRGGVKEGDLEGNT